MRSPNRQYLPEIDELRGAAALLVLFYHSTHTGWLSTGHAGWLTSRLPGASVLFEGHTAVGLFVVLSGFVLAHGAVDRDIRYGRFLANRLLRVLPLAALAFVFALSGSRDYTLAGVLAPFLLMQNTPLAFADATQLSGVLWYTSIAFQLYLIAPFLIASTSRRGLWGFLLPAIAAAFLLKLLVLAPHADRPDELFRVSYSTIAGRLSQFLIGIGLAFALAGAKETSRKVGIWLLAGASLGIVAFTWALNLGGGVSVWHHWRVIHPELEALLWATFIAGYLACRPAGRRAGGALRRVGLWSFSLCVLHWPLQVQFWAAYKTLVGYELSLRGIVALTAVALMPTALCLAALSFKCVERPFLELRGRYLSGRPEHAAEALATV